MTCDVRRLLDAIAQCQLGQGDIEAVSVAPDRAEWERKCAWRGRMGVRGSASR